MKIKNLENLISTHFDFLKEEHGFVYESEPHRYVRDGLSIEIQHMSGELDVIFTLNEKSILFPELMSLLKKEAFSYPDYFSSWVLSMGDVDSRLAYDAKLMREYGSSLFDEIFKVIVEL